MTQQAIDIAAPAIPDVRLIGGEMLDWSDDAGTGRVRPIGPAVMRVLERALPARGVVLVAGPHDPLLVERIADRGLSVHLLLRSAPDARAARVRFAETHGSTGGSVSIVCGALDRLEPANGEPYDAVVALDGVERLGSPDSRIAGWAASVAALAALARPGASIALLVPNGFGIGRLVDVEVPSLDHGPEGAAEPPRGYDAVVAAMAVAELQIDGALAVYPSRRRPSLLATVDGLEAPSAPTLVAAACAGDDDEPKVTEPRRLARDAVRYGLGFALAPAWIVTAIRSATPAERTTRAELLLLDGFDDEAAYWSVPQVIERAPDGGWQRRLIDPHDLSERTLGLVGRDPTLLTGPVPDGELVEELLLAACARHDNASLRHELGRYADWLRASASSGGIAPQRVFAWADNIVDAPTGLALLDPSWTFGRPVPVVVAFIAAMRRFAARLLDGGYVHPWPSAISVDRLAVTLASMAGVAPTAADLDAADQLGVDCDVRWQSRRGDGQGDPSDEGDPGTADVAPAPRQRRALGHREAVVLAARRAAELDEAHAQIEWLDETIAERNEQLSIAARKMKALRTSITYRLGNLVTFPFQMLIRIIRRGLRP